MLATLMGVAGFADDDRFSRETFTLGETTLHFRLADICHNGTEKPILVLYLHGGTARGDDNEAQLSYFPDFYAAAIYDLYGRKVSSP
ncbi:MAG: hypothetical protein K6G08_02760, partial [Prevotella sp.]|nr:hypothetical protein [Prevotella sp.]